MAFSVIVCYNCGQLLLAKKSQKTRQCPHCAVKVAAERARVVAHAATAREASELIRALKQKREQRKAGS